MNTSGRMGNATETNHADSALTSSQGSPAASSAGDLVYQNGTAATTPKPNWHERPRTYPYFTTLPYEVESEQKRQDDLAEILKYLYIAVEAGDFTPGAVHWTRELRSWLSLKFIPTKEQRLKLVKLYYELALAPGVEPSVAERFASMFMMLTKYVFPWDFKMS